MDANYAAELQDFGIATDIKDTWCYVGHSARRQGWKIHVSSIPTEASQLLSLVATTILDGNGSSYKFARNEFILRQLNEGALGDTQVGKFITIYPPSDEDSKRLAEQLITATQKFSGPTVVTDLSLGGVIYSRYGSFKPITYRNRLGQIELLICRPDGTTFVDTYKVPYEIPRGVNNPFRCLTFTRNNEMKTNISDGSNHATNNKNSRTKLFGSGYLLLNILKSGVKGRVFLALDLRDKNKVGLKVIKEGRQHCLSDSLARDARTRLRYQETLHLNLQDIIHIPKVSPYFEIAGNGYLPMEYIEGYDIATYMNIPFSSLTPNQQKEKISIMANLISCVEKLHSMNYVHRDLTPSNIRITHSGEVYLLDLELAVNTTQAEQAFSLGTPGFMSPQQFNGDLAAVEDDVYSIACVIINFLSCLSPKCILFSGVTDLAFKIHKLTGAPRILSSIIAKCVNHLPENRPTLSELAEVIAEILKSTNRNQLIPGRIKKTDNLSDIRLQAKKILSSALDGLLHDVIVDKNTGLCLSSKFNSNDDARYGQNENYILQRSTNRGISGVLYVLARFEKFGIKSDNLQHYAEQSIDWLLAHAPTSDDQLPGLHFGEAGVAVAIAETIHCGLVKKGSWFDEYMNEALTGPLDWPDVTHGAAGQGIAVFACADLLENPEYLNFSHRCAKYLLNTQSKEGYWEMPAGVDGMSGSRYTGFAHGTAGIIYFLAEYAWRFRCKTAEYSWQQAVNWLMEMARSNNIIEWPTKEGADECWKWWCHGAPGIALTFLKLFEITNNYKYADIAHKALLVNNFDIRNSNLSQCHGLSGLGEIYLEAARVLNDSTWTIRAANIANILLHLARKSKNGGVTWLVENSTVATGDLMVGCGGVSHFLLRFALQTKDLSAPLLLNALNQNSNDVNNK